MVVDGERSRDLHERGFPKLHAVGESFHANRDGRIEHQLYHLRGAVKWFYRHGEPDRQWSAHGSERYFQSFFDWRWFRFLYSQYIYDFFHGGWHLHVDRHGHQRKLDGKDHRHAYGHQFDQLLHGIYRIERCVIYLVGNYMEYRSRRFHRRRRNS